MVLRENTLWMKQLETILCLTVRTTVTSASVFQRKMLNIARVTGVLSHTFKKESRD